MSQERPATVAGLAERFAGAAQLTDDATRHLEIGALLAADELAGMAVVDLDALDDATRDAVGAALAGPWHAQVGAPWLLVGSRRSAQPGATDLLWPVVATHGDPGWPAAAVLATVGVGTPAGEARPVPRLVGRAEDCLVALAGTGGRLRLIARAHTGPDAPWHVGADGRSRPVALVEHVGALRAAALAESAWDRLTGRA